MTRTIKTYANTLTEAFQKLNEMIPDGHFLISLSENMPHKSISKGIGNTNEEAFLMAKNNILTEVNNIREKVIREPFTKKIEKTAFNDKDARSATQWEIRNEDAAEIVGIDIEKKGKKGLLGIGKKPSVYSVEVVYKSIVELEFETLAEILAETCDDITTAERAFVSAAEKGNIKLVRFLLDQGIDINSTNDENANALMLASFNGHHEIALLLLQKNIDVTRQDRGGFNALILACETKSPNITLVQKIIESGANINATSKRGATALMTAAKIGHLGIVKLLLEKGANIDATNTDHNITALIWAANEGHRAIVEFLLEKGANKNIMTYNNYTAETIAKENGHYDIVNLINRY